MVDGAIDLQGMGNVVANEGEVRIAAQVLHVGQGAGDEVIHADDFMPALQEALAQVRADEARSAGDQGSHSLLLRVLGQRPLPEWFTPASGVWPLHKARDRKVCR